MAILYPLGGEGVGSAVLYPAALVKAGGAYKAGESEQGGLKFMLDLDAKHFVRSGWSVNPVLGVPFGVSDRMYVGSKEPAPHPR